MMFVALSGLLGSYGIATHRIAFSVPLILGVTGTLVGIIVAHASLAQVVQVVAIGNAITALGVAGALLWQALAQAPPAATPA